MTVLSSTELRECGPALIQPFLRNRVVDENTGMSYGLSSCGYDIRLRQDFVMWPGRCVLASSIEQFYIPPYLRMTIFDKSTMARKFITCQTTVAEPGWRGFLTLELINHSWKFVRLHAGQPIAQVCFDRLSSVSDQPYSGKYQDQHSDPVPALREQVKKGFWAKYFSE